VLLAYLVAANAQVSQCGSSSSGISGGDSWTGVEEDGEEEDGEEEEEEEAMRAAIDCARPTS
jgi:hypothetical protein